MRSHVHALSPSVRVGGVAGKTALRTPDTGRTGQLPHSWNAELALQSASFGTVHLTKQTLEAAFQLFQRLDTDGSGGLDAKDMEPLGSCLCPSDTLRSTRRRKALEAIVAELRLAEADTDGNSTVDFIEFMEAFKRRTLQMPLTHAAASGEATFGQQLSSIHTGLNRTVMTLITQMAELLESGTPGMPVGSP